MFSYATPRRRSCTPMRSRSLWASRQNVPSRPKIGCPLSHSFFPIELHSPVAFAPRLASVCCRMPHVARLSGALDAPPAEDFQTVWAQLAAGRRCRRGIATIGSERRVVKLAGCLYEALREADAHFLLHSDVIWLARDARQSRLLIRFKCAAFQKGEIVVKHGVLGQAKNGGSSAQQILEATKSIVIRACTPTTLATTTPHHGAPSSSSKHWVSGGWRGQGERAEGEGAVAWDQTFAGADNDTAAAAEQSACKIFGKIEAITVDSAADEVLSGELMRGQCQIQLSQAAPSALTPNLRLVLRDVTHASRRPRRKQAIGASAHARFSLTR